MRIKLCSKCENCKKRKLFTATRTVSINNFIATSRSYICNTCIKALRNKLNA